MRFSICDGESQSLLMSEWCFYCNRLEKVRSGRWKTVSVYFVLLRWSFHTSSKSSASSEDKSISQSPALSSSPESAVGKESLLRLDSTKHLNSSISFLTSFMIALWRSNGASEGNLHLTYVFPCSPDTNNYFWLFLLIFLINAPHM